MADRDVQWAVYVRVLGLCRRSRFELHGDPEDLEDALRLVQDALDNAPEQYLMLWCDLTESIWMRARYFGDRGDLDQAVELAEQLLPELTEDADPLGVEIRTHYADMMHVRYTIDGDPADLDEAVTMRRGLLSSSQLDEDDRPPLLVAHGHSLHLRFERTQRAADLDEAVAVLGEAMAGDHPLRPTAAFELSGSLLQRFLRTRDRADIDAAVEVARQESDSGPDMLTALSRALGRRFDNLRDPADQDEAIEVGRDAIAATPGEHPDAGQNCGNLSVPGAHHSVRRIICGPARSCTGAAACRCRCRSSTEARRSGNGMSHASSRSAGRRLPCQRFSLAIRKRFGVTKGLHRLVVPRHATQQGSIAANGLIRWFEHVANTAAVPDATLRGVRHTVGIHLVAPGPGPGPWPRGVRSAAAP